MHIAIVLIAIVLVGSGILIRSKTTSETSQEEVVLGDLIPTNTSTPTHTTTPIQETPSPSPTLPAKQDPVSRDTQFLYPAATIKAQSDSSVTLESSDDPQAITDWYKNKIKELGMNTRSFVQTKTNDNVHNVLVAAKSSEEIKVTITKDSGDQQASIVVEL